MMVCRQCGKAFERTVTPSWATGDGSMVTGVLVPRGPRTPKCCSQRCNYNWWVAANPDKAKAIEVVKRQRNRDAIRAQRQRFADANPGYEKLWTLAHPERRRALWKRGQLARLARKAGVLLTVDARAEECGVCLKPIDHLLQYPDPMSPSVGHEPPLAVAAREGWLIVCERWEHLVCNLRKGDRLDVDLTSSFNIA